MLLRISAHSRSARTSRPHLISGQNNPADLEGGQGEDVGLRGLDEALAEHDRQADRGKVVAQVLGEQHLPGEGGGQAKTMNAVTMSPSVQLAPCYRRGGHAPHRRRARQAPAAPGMRLPV